MSIESSSKKKIVRFLQSVKGKVSSLRAAGIYQMVASTDAGAR